jgi:hypothetical protein
MQAIIGTRPDLPDDIDVSWGSLIAEYLSQKAADRPECDIIY